MTGAQERALDRLKKKHRSFSYSSRGSIVTATWTKDTATGTKFVTAEVDPSGRVVEKP